MKHLLEYSKKQKNYNLDGIYSEDCPRVINHLWDVGTRHRQIGKSTAIAELAYSSALKNPIVEVIVIVPKYGDVDYMKKLLMEQAGKVMVGIFYGQPQVRVEPLVAAKEYIKYVENFGGNKKIIVLADDCNLLELTPEWNSECIVEKCGWFVPEFNRDYK